MRKTPVTSCAHLRRFPQSDLTSATSLEVSPSAILAVMPAFDPNSYGPVFSPLLDIDRRRPLGTGEPDSDVRPALKKLSVDSAFAHAKVVDNDMAACCISGVWLLHDFLDESHSISQDIDTTSGSFWHAIMHRREGDFWNSKYWFRRVGQHPAFERIMNQAKQAADAPPRAWDPFGFVDGCEAALSKNQSDRDTCVDLQQIEWESLFDYCYHAAVRK